MMQGLKDPRQQSKLGRLADRDVNLAHAQNWSRERMMTARQLADQIEALKQARRQDVPGISDRETLTAEQRGAKFKDAMERGIAIGTGAPAIAASGLIPMGLRAGLLAQTPGALMVDAVNRDNESAGFNTGLGALAALGPASLPIGIAALATAPSEAVAGPIEKSFVGGLRRIFNKSELNDLRDVVAPVSGPRKLSPDRAAILNELMYNAERSLDPSLRTTVMMNDKGLPTAAYQLREESPTLNYMPYLVGFERGAGRGAIQDAKMSSPNKNMHWVSDPNPDLVNYYRSIPGVKESEAEGLLNFTLGMAGGGSVAGMAKRLAQRAMDLEGNVAPAGALSVIKNKGGNWLTGSVEGALGGLKPLHAPYGNRFSQDQIDFLAANPKAASLNNWIDKQLTRYVKNDMATPEDPIRALAERGVLHFDPNEVAQARRTVHPSGEVPRVMGESPLARAWEQTSDSFIAPETAGRFKLTRGQDGTTTLSRNPWLEKLPNDAIVHDVYESSRPSQLGFSHLTDELANALNPESGLPRHLLLDPKSMDRVSVPQAIERVAAINAWRAAQKAEADMLRANNAATVLHKEYPDKGLRWVELKADNAAKDAAPVPEELNNKNFGLEAWQQRNPPQESYRKAHIEWMKGQEGEGPDISFSEAMWKVDPEWVSKEFNLNSPAQKARQALQDALKYEGDTMGHCVGGYCDNVASGRSRIYSLRDAKGQPHVTVEVNPGEGFAGKRTREEYEAFLRGHETPHSEEEIAQALQELDKGGAWSPSIVQIKGKQNRAPNPEYLPFVQDFVKSGQWSDVGDLQNAGLQRAGWAPDVLERMKAHGIEAPEYGTADEINAALNALNKAKGFAHGGPVNKNNLSVQQLQRL